MTTHEHFTCERCHYDTHRIDNFRRHLSGVKECSPLHSDKTRESLLEILNSNINGENDRHRICDYCAKIFKSRQGRWKHQRNHCKKKPDDNNSQESIVGMLKALQEEVKELKTQSNTPSTNTSNSNNVQTNIQIHQHNQINAFGHESQDHLTHAFLNTCVRRTNKGFIQLLEKLHFDKDMQGRNANVRCPNKKIQLLQYNDGQRWKYERRNTVINDMIDKGQGILQEHFEDNQEEIKDDISETMWQYITKWMEKMEHRDKSTLESLLTDIYILILNNSEELVEK